MLSAAAALTLSLLAQPAFAQAPELGLDQRLQRDALLDRVAEHFDASQQPGAELGHGPSCLMGLVQELKASRALFSDQEWAWITDRVFLVDDALTAPPAATPEDEGDQPVLVSCLGRQGANAVSSEHFVVEWDSASVNETMAQNTLTALETSWETFVEEYGWQAPSGTDEYPTLFYISNDNYAGAYTTTSYCSSVGDNVAYIVAGRGSYSAGDWYKTMAGHEFHHAIQFGYSESHEFYWWEASATWSEEYAYPEINDWAEMYWAFSFYPFIAFNASNQQDQYIFYHMYAMGIFGTFLDENYGGHDIVRETWEASASHNGYYNYGMPDVIEDIGLVWDEVYPHFMATTAWMDFEESRYYYTVQEAQDYGSTGILDEVSSLPDSGDELRNAPQSLGLNHVFFDADLGEEGRYLQVDFTGSDEADAWYVVLTTGDDHDLVDWAVAELDENLQGSVSIPFDGSEHAYLVVSPYDDRAVGFSYNWLSAEEFDFEWEACMVDTQGAAPCSGLAEETGDDSGDSPATPSSGDEDGKPSSCSTAGAAPALGALWALGLVGLAVRRRR